MARASRTSEAAPAPAAVAPAPAPAAAKIPEFAAPASPEQPVVTRWDSYAADDDGGMPNGDPSAQPTPKADTGEKVTVDAEGNPVRKAAATPELQSLRDQLRPEEGTPETPPEVEAPAKPKSAERRRAVLDALGSETRLRSTETALQTEREGRARVERLLKEGSLGEILAARGIDRDLALEQLATGTEGKPPEAKPAAELPPEVKELRDEVRALKAQNQEAARREGMAAVERETIAHEAVPVVHAAIKAGTIVDYDRATGRPLTATELISNAAAAKWRAAGAVNGDQQRYVQEAAEVLEEILIEQHDPIAQAIQKKRGPAAPAPAAPAPRAASTIGRKIAARPDAKPAPLPFDREARDAEIKKRYGW